MLLSQDVAVKILMEQDVEKERLKEFVREVSCFCDAKGTSDVISASVG